MNTNRYIEKLQKKLKTNELHEILRCNRACPTQLKYLSCSSSFLFVFFVLQRCGSGSLSLRVRVQIGSGSDLEDLKSHFLY
mgnify:CR=1 FL=1